MPKVTLEQLKIELKRQFPLMWIKDGAEFSSSSAGSLWTGEGSQVKIEIPELPDEVHTLPMFDYYSGSDLYIFGVYKELHDFLAERGYYTEAYDGGTYFIYPS